PISDLESLGEVAVNHHVGVGSGSVLSSGGDVNLIADTLANRIVEAWGKGQSWLTAVAGALGGDSATAEQVGGTNLNSISASVRIDGDIHVGINKNQSVEFIVVDNPGGNPPWIASFGTVNPGDKLIGFTTAQISV